MHREPRSLIQTREVVDMMNELARGYDETLLFSESSQFFYPSFILQTSPSDVSSLSGRSHVATNHPLLMFPPEVGVTMTNLASVSSSSQRLTCYFRVLATGADNTYISGHPRHLVQWLLGVLDVHVHVRSGQSRPTQSLYGDRASGPHESLSSSRSIEGASGLSSC